MNEKRVTGFCKCLFALACKVFVCMITVAVSITTFALQGVIASSVEEVVEREPESVQGQEPLTVSYPGEVLGLADNLASRIPSSIKCCLLAIPSRSSWNGT